MLQAVSNANDLKKYLYLSNLTLFVANLTTLVSLTFPPLDESATCSRAIGAAVVLLVVTGCFTLYMAL